MAELPGVEEKDIKLELKDDALTISAETRDRKYRKDIPLPAPVKPETLKSKYKNGVLDITVKK